MQYRSNIGVLLAIVPFLVIIAVVLSCAKLGPQPNANYSPTPTTQEREDLKKFNGQQALKNRTDEYAKLPAKVQLTDSPYITKKVAYLKTWKEGNETKAEMQNFWASFTTPDEVVMNEILANSPEEVGTIVLIEDDKKEHGCKDVPKGTYKDQETGSVVNGYIQVCEMTIIDPQIPAVIFRRKFEGQLRKTEYMRKESGRVLGQVDFAEVYNFLAGLPRK